MGDLFSFKVVIENIPKLLKFLPVTLEVSAWSLITALLLGLIVAVIKMKKVPVLKQIVALYISILRGTPIIVQLYVTYFGIPLILKYINFYYGTSYNIDFIPKIMFAIIALGINESAFMAESIRAALQSVDQGQIEAAQSLGMTSFQTFFRITLPEAIEVALPSLGNSIIGLVKGTSLAFVCAVVEMTAEGKIIAGRTYRYFESYVSLAIIYWLVTIIIEKIIGFLENLVKVPDQVPDNGNKRGVKKHDRDQEFIQKISEQHSA